MSDKPIPFNWPHVVGKELAYITEAQKLGQLAGDGTFTKRCQDWVEQRTGCSKALLTHSCTAALEMAALLANVEPGDEVIMPSFTFVSTANAFVLRGARPVFVDVRPDTLNIDEHLIEAAITPHTRAIVAVHYAGVACEMDAIIEIACRHNLIVVEDAAQGVLARYKGQSLGNIGHLGAYSFHETKNVISGEGGCLLVRDPALIARAEIIREKGTDRNRFFRGEVDKYTWQDVGSSFLPGELIAAFLWAQLEVADTITQRRMTHWEYYHARLAELETEGRLRRPIIPAACQHNAHLYYVMLSPEIDRQAVLDALKRNNMAALFHYVPLHSSPAGQRYGRAHGMLPVTDLAARQLIRLPLFIGITEAQQDRVIETLTAATRSKPGHAK
ncbi:MAG: dTDP-4-amino-4,6-dideoxygalactose transaminase [Xanthobacteraceae bacterium]|nr:dTDP-4-amino-4,6-dideoxygalactose transaminase [Xanthobacteraceae bacterium]